MWRLSATECTLYHGLSPSCSPSLHSTYTLVLYVFLFGPESLKLICLPFSPPCRAVDIGAAQLKQVQDSAVYRTLYRPISAVADPALDAIAASPGYNAIVDHLRPQSGITSAAGSA